MKPKLKIFAALACAAACALSFTACKKDGGNGESTLLGGPRAVESVDYPTLRTDGYIAFKTSVESFAADFAARAYADCEGSGNLAVSPVSVYSALALSAECAAGETRNEILSALGVTHEQLQTHFSTLYRSLEVEHKTAEKTTGTFNLTNSVWVNDGTQVKQACIDSLSDNYYAYSYSADFAFNNKEANKAVRSFVKKRTRGLIDKNFELPEETLFTLINTLYLKTVWNTNGRDLPLTGDKYTFTAKDGSTKMQRFLQGDYIAGRAAEGETYSTYYTRTYDGYKIKFILPKNGYSVDEVFTAENIAAVNSITDYGAYGDAGVTYATRCIFPEYKCGYDGDIVKILRQSFGIDLFFKDHINYTPACDFSTLSDESCYCKTVRHVTDLTVDRKGIEGAAVTVVGMNGDAASPEPVKEDFIVDGAFGFIVTDWQDITLFSGVVNEI